MKSEAWLGAHVRSPSLERGARVSDNPTISPHQRRHKCDAERSSTPRCGRGITRCGCAPHKLRRRSRSREGCSLSSSPHPPVGTRIYLACALGSPRITTGTPSPTPGRMTSPAARHRPQRRVPTPETARRALRRGPADHRWLPHGQYRQRRSQRPLHHLRQQRAPAPESHRVADGASTRHSVGQFVGKS